jgi:hypothetical protein
VAQLLDLSKGFLQDIDNQLATNQDEQEAVFLEDVKIGTLLNK